MADEQVTTQLNIDITQFKTALSEANRYVRMANAEFELATAGTEKWSDSADGLKAKITQLNKTLGGQEMAAAALREEYERVSKENGENSKAAQELAIKLNKQEAACKRTAAQIKKYEGDLSDMEDGNTDAGKATEHMAVSFDKATSAAGRLASGLAKIAGKTIATGIKTIAAAAGTLVAGFLASGEASRDYIMEMGKLNTAFTSSGHSAETAQKAYTDLVGVLGETDQAVEASNHLAKLTQNEKELATWTGDILPGVFATFGDSLPLEGLTEAANETARVGAVTGPLADALNWAGVSEDEFNTSLAACNDEQERAALITSTLTTLYSEAAEAYKATNAEVIRANQANAAWMQSMAGVGSAALPVTSSIKLMGAALLNDLLPNIQTFGQSFSEALEGSKSAAANMGQAVGAMLQQLGSKIVTALPTVLTIGGNIVSSLVEGIIASAPAIGESITQVVEYLIQAAPTMLAAGASMVQSLVGAISSNLPALLAAGGQMIYEILSGISANLPDIAQGALGAIDNFVQGLQTNLPVIMSKGSELLGQLSEGIGQALPGLVDQALNAIMNFATTIYDNAPALIETGFNVISNLVEGILNSLPTLIAKAPEIISKFANTINDNMPTILAKGVQLIGQIIMGLISAIPTLIANIPKIISAIVDVWSAFNWLDLGKNAITAVKNGITNMVGAIKTAGKNVAETLTNVIKELPAKLMELGKTAISKMRDGITNMVGAVRSAGADVLSKIVGAISSLPSKLLELGKNAISNIASAISAGVGTVKAKATDVFTGIVDAFKNLPQKMLEIGKNIIQGIINGIGNMVGTLYDSIKNALSGLVDKAKEALGINSPSKVFANIVGRAIPEGIAKGIKDNSKYTDKAVTDLTKDTLAAANRAMSGVSLSGPTMTGGVDINGASAGQGGNGYVLNQYITSPKPLTRAEIYRDTKNLLRFATRMA